MNPTQWAAWFGALVGLGNLAWNIYTKLSAGPKLRVGAYSGMVQRPAPRGDPHFLRINVQNVGTQSTTITNVSFYRYKSRWKRLRGKMMEKAFLLVDFTGPQLPHKLEVGAEWMACMQENDKFEAMVLEGMWCPVHHAFSAKPTQVKIYAPPREEQ